MSSFWHFGDSWGLSGNEKTFSHYISEKLGLKWKHRCVGGYSNQKIVSSILSETDNFTSGDIILINWSYWNRPNFFYNTKVHSCINVDLFGDPVTPEDYKNKINFSIKVDTGDLESINDNDYIEYKTDVINFYLKHNFDRFANLFLDIVTPFLSTIEKRGVRIYHAFIDSFDVNFKYCNKPISLKFSDFNIPGKELDFNSGWYGRFVHTQDLFAHPDEATHYKFNRQEFLAEKYLEQMGLY